MIAKQFMLWIALFCVLVFALLCYMPLHAAPSQQCAPPECNQPTPNNPPPEQPANNNQGGGWSGYSDGRLNPDMAEYYSVWCASNQVEVWGGMPNPQLIAAIPIRQILDMTAPFTAPPDLTVIRSGDIVVISGTGGNNGDIGSKAFSLSECVAHNGGEPPAAPNNPPAQQHPPAPTPTVDPFEEAGSTVGLCLPGTESLGDFIQCLNFFSPDDPSPCYTYFVAWAVATFCSGGIAPLAMVAALPAIRLWRRRK